MVKVIADIDMYLHVSEVGKEVRLTAEHAIQASGRFARQPLLVLRQIVPVSSAAVSQYGGGATKVGIQAADKPPAKRLDGTISFICRYFTH